MSFAVNAREAEIFHLGRVSKRVKPQGTKPFTLQKKKFENGLQIVIREVLQKENFKGVGFTAEMQGNRAVVKVGGIASEIEYELARALAKAIDELKHAIFHDDRFHIHHEVYINEKKVSWSY